MISRLPLRELSTSVSKRSVPQPGFFPGQKSPAAQRSDGSPASTSLIISTSASRSSPASTSGALGVTTTGASLPAVGGLSGAPGPIISGLSSGRVVISIAPGDALRAADRSPDFEQLTN